MDVDANSTESRIGELQFVGIDANEPDGCAEFWAAVLGVEITRRWKDGYITLRAQHEGAPRLFIQKVPERKKAKNRVHFDIKVNDLDAAIAMVESLGGSLISVSNSEEFDPEQCRFAMHRFAVMADPEGNEFCMY